MIFRILRPSLALALVFLGLVAGLNAAAARAYKGAIVMDASTGKVLFEDNADVVSPPASMTKLMTLAVVDDAHPLGQDRAQHPGHRHPGRRQGRLDAGQHRRLAPGKGSLHRR